jgi:hypothetical protein
MPTRLNTNFPRLTDDNEFESMICDICALEWNDLNTKKFARPGQKQHGVDAYGQPPDLNGKYRAVQCKLRTKGNCPTEKEIEKEVREARQFPHSLESLIIVTDARRDKDTQVIIDRIREREVRNGGFKVFIWFWEDITERLATYPKLLVKYYADYLASLTTRPIVEKLVDTPLRFLQESGIPLRVPKLRARAEVPRIPTPEGISFPKHRFTLKRS